MAKWKWECQTCQRAKACPENGLCFPCLDDECKYEPFQNFATTSTKYDPSKFAYQTSKRLIIEQYNVISPFQILDNDAQARQNNEHLAKVLYQKICGGDKSIQRILIMPDVKQRGYVITIEREASQ